MLVVETIGRIRREHFVRGKSIKEIVRALKVSRNTVRKVLRSGATSFEYMRVVQPRAKLGAWDGDLDRMLLENEGKPARERLTLIRMFEELRGLGYQGSYDAVRRYAKAWRVARGAATAEAYVPLSFAPGEAYQFDWSHEVVLINGTTVTVKVAHVRLCHSRMLFVRAYPRETQEMVFDAHNRAFAFFKGTCTRGIYDNMKTAVETVFIGKDRQYNRRFLRMCGHYLIEPTACTPASGWSARSWCRSAAGSTGSTRSRHRSRRPAWCGSTTTSTRSARARSAGRSRSRLMPSASSSARTARSSAIMRAASVAARRSTTPGITCRYSLGSPVRSGTAPRSRIGRCRPVWSACGAS